MIPLSSKKVSILGVPILPITVGELHTYIASIIHGRHKALVLNANVHGINLAFALPWMMDFFNRAELVFCDGAGVVLAGRLLGYNIPGRITYADWMWKLSAFAEQEDISLFFLGSRPGVAERAAECLRARYPQLCILGTHHGYFNKQFESIENTAVITTINEVRPDILVVGFGMPMQERWLMENWLKLDAHIALTGGAVFDYVSGNLTRAPRWMTDHGLEWLGKLMIEPKRLWKRYLIGNPLFIWRVMMQKIGVLKFE